MGTIKQVKLFLTGLEDWNKGDPRQKLYKTQTLKHKDHKLLKKNGNLVKNICSHLGNSIFKNMYECWIFQPYITGRLTFYLKETICIIT
jgi:hypothetical protein